MSILIQTALAITVLCASTLGVFIFAKKKLSYTRILLILHLFGISIWAYSTLMVLQQGSFLAVKIAFASAVILSISKFYFIVNFPKTKSPSGVLGYLPLIFAMVIFVFAFFDNTYFTNFSVVEGYYVLIENGPYANLFMSVISFILIYPIINLYRKMRSGSFTGYVADQIKFLFLGTTFFFVLGLTTNQILPVVFNINQFNGIGPSLSLISAGFIVYIISKYHFLGLSVVIQRSFIYSTLITVIVGIYFSTLFVLETIFHQTSETSPVISGLLTAIIGIFSVPRIDTYLRRKTDRFFFKDKYNYSDALQQILKTLNLSIEISNIKKQTIELLEKTLKTSAVEFDIKSSPVPYTKKNKVHSTKDDGAVSVPLISTNKQIGNLLVHKKLSGDLYTASDLQLLETLSYHLAIAFERALLHKELQDYSKQLEEKVSLRTAELNQAYQSQQVMISNIAHSLQTPLTIIGTELESLKTNDYVSEKIVPLKHSFSSISNFISDLLRLAHLESEANSIDFEDIELEPMIEDIVSYVTILAADKKVSIKYEIISNANIQGDPKKIEEVLLSLISNAIKYRSPSKETHLHIRLESDGNNAIISIADSGIGIPEESLKRIFDRFYRVQNDSTSDIQGSGLGLPIALAIIKKHYGDIKVKSVVAVGTTFTVIIPLSLPSSESSSRVKTP